MSVTNQLTFELGFKVKNSDEVKTFTFSVYYDRADVDEPKDVAIQHCLKLAEFEEFKALVPWFKTFRVIRDHVPSDLAL